MTFQEKLEAKLKERLHPTHMKVENESHKHNVPPNSHTHYKITIVADIFTSLTKVQRHRMVYEIFLEELQEGLKALSIWALTPKEFEQYKEPFASPPCLGGEEN